MHGPLKSLAEPPNSWRNSLKLFTRLDPRHHKPDQPPFHPINRVDLPGECLSSGDTTLFDLKKFPLFPIEAPTGRRPSRSHPSWPRNLCACRPCACCECAIPTNRRATLVCHSCPLYWVSPPYSLSVLFAACAWLLVMNTILEEVEEANIVQYWRNTNGYFRERQTTERIMRVMTRHASRNHMGMGCAKRDGLRGIRIYQGKAL